MKTLIIIRSNMDPSTDGFLTSSETKELITDMDEAIAYIRSKYPTEGIIPTQLATIEQYAVDNFEWDNF